MRQNPDFFPCVHCIRSITPFLFVVSLVSTRFTEERLVLRLRLNVLLRPFKNMFRVLASNVLRTFLNIPPLCASTECTFDKTINSTAVYSYFGSDVV